jgi:acyl-coenzyme A thioesterase PaaI-like protein
MSDTPEPAPIEPTYREESGLWHPSAQAAGPFGGLHGGGISGILIAGLERKARQEGYGVPLNAGVMFLRPAPMAPLETRLAVLRAGGRVALLENALWVEDRLIARATATFVAAIPALPTEHMPIAAPEPRDPTDLPKLRFNVGLDHPSFFDTLDLRDDGAGTKWGRLLRPIVDFPAPLAGVFAVADNSQPFSILPARRPRLRFPNIDITIHVSRAPTSDWIGVEARSDWRPAGYGMTEAALRDTTGPLGRSCQTIVLAPVK